MITWSDAMGPKYRDERALVLAVLDRLKEEGRARGWTGFMLVDAVWDRTGGTPVCAIQLAEGERDPDIADVRAVLRMVPA